MRYTFENFFHFVYPSGKPMPRHLLRCQGLAVNDYSFALGRLEAGTPSTFAQLGFNRPMLVLEKVRRPNTLSQDKKKQSQPYNNSKDRCLDGGSKEYGI